MHSYINNIHTYVIVVPFFYIIVVPPTFFFEMGSYYIAVTSLKLRDPPVFTSCFKEYSWD